MAKKDRKEKWKLVMMALAFVFIGIFIGVVCVGEIYSNIVQDISNNCSAYKELLTFEVQALDYCINQTNQSIESFFEDYLHNFIDKSYNGK